MKRKAIHRSAPTFQQWKLLSPRSTESPTGLRNTEIGFAIEHFCTFIHLGCSSVTYSACFPTFNKYRGNGETTTKSENSAASKKLWGNSLAGDGKQRMYDGVRATRESDTKCICPEVRLI